MDILFWAIFVILIGMGLYAFANMYYTHAVDRADREKTMTEHIIELGEAWSKVMTTVVDQLNPVFEQLLKTIMNFERAMK